MVINFPSPLMQLHCQVFLHHLWFSSAQLILWVFLWAQKSLLMHRLCYSNKNITKEIMNRDFYKWKWICRRSYLSIFSNYLDLLPWMSIYLNKKVNGHEQFQGLHVKRCLKNGRELSDLFEYLLSCSLQKLFSCGIDKTKHYYSAPLLIFL